MIDALSSYPVVFTSSFSLIGLAEIGDKSQIVCMALAMRYRAQPVLLGAIAAFALLNLVAVLFGAAIAQWLPEQVITLVVGLLFLAFGLHAIRNSADDEDEVIEDKGSHSIFVGTAILITLAEFGDKTQIAVASLASTADGSAVWLGATLALAIVSALGVFAGRTVLQKIPVSLLHKTSGTLFILFGVMALGSLAVS